MRRLEVFPSTLLASATIGVLAGMLFNVGLAQTENERNPENKTSKSKNAEAPGNDTTAGKSKVWTCPLHPKVRQGQSGRCPICALELAPVRLPAQAWTCPMHPAIRHDQEGRCPICAMELVVIELPANASGRRTGPMSVQEMLSVALKHNPDVRVAEAKLRSVEAELDQTRLQVVQKIIAYREKWQTQQVSVRTAEQELVEAKRTEKLAKQGLVAEKSAKLVAVASERLALHRAKLAEIEAELPFLLGTTAARADRGSANSRKLIRDQILPKAQQILKLRTQEYTTGDAQLRDVIDAHLQILDLELRLATSPTKRRAVLQSQQALLKELHDIAQARYRAGKGSQGDILAIDLEISNVDLKRMELLEN